MSDLYEVDMTNEELLIFAMVLSGIVNSETKFPFKFSYAVNRTQRSIQDQVLSIQNALRTSSVEMDEYNREYADLVSKHSVKDEDGNLKKFSIDGVKGYKYKLIDEEAYNKEKEELDERYKDQISENLERTEKISKFLKEETKVKIFQISDGDIPEELKLTVPQVEVFSRMIKDDNSK